MAYRNELEQLRARVEELEGQLTDERETVARLRGERPVATRAPVEADWLTGVPPHLSIEHELPFSLDNEAYEAIKRLIDQRLPGGTAAQVGRTFTHKKGSYELQLSPTEPGGTRMVLTGDYGAGRLLLALGGAGIGILTGPPFAAIAGALGAGKPIMALLGAFGFMVGWWGLRALMKRNMHAEQERLNSMFEAVVELAVQHHARTKARIAEGARAEPKRRIEAEPSAAEQAEPKRRVAVESAAAEAAEPKRRIAVEPGADEQAELLGEAEAEALFEQLLDDEVE